MQIRAEQRAPKRTRLAPLLGVTGEVLFEETLEAFPCRGCAAPKTPHRGHTSVDVEGIERRPEIGEIDVGSRRTLGSVAVDRDLVKCYEILVLSPV